MKTSTAPKRVTTLLALLERLRRPVQITLDLQAARTADGCELLQAEAAELTFESDAETLRWMPSRWLFANNRSANIAGGHGSGGRAWVHCGQHGYPRSR